MLGPAMQLEGVFGNAAISTNGARKRPFASMRSFMTHQLPSCGERLFTKLTFFIGALNIGDQVVKLHILQDINGIVDYSLAASPLPFS